MHQRALSGTGSSDDADRLSRLRRKCNILEGFSTGPLICQGNMVKLNACRRHLLSVFLKGLTAVLQTAFYLKQCLYTVSACHALGRHNDRICHFNKLDKDLGHIIDQRNDLSLFERTHVNANRTCPDQCNQRTIDHNVSDRVHQCRNTSHEKLHSCQKVIFSAKAFALCLLLVECTDHTDTA